MGHIRTRNKATEEDSVTEETTEESPIIEADRVSLPMLLLQVKLLLVALFDAKEGNFSVVVVDDDTEGTFGCRGGNPAASSR
jgi:hypothetical protein